MAVAIDCNPISSFEEWYASRSQDARTGAMIKAAPSPDGDAIIRAYEHYKREMDVRVGNYHKLVQLADAEVITPKPDLPNISSGETAGLVRRMARNLVQHTPNVNVISVHDDDSVRGIFARHILTSKIIGDSQYSNDMQQNLFASTKTALTLGFAAVIPVLLQDAAGGWYVKYDPIHYRDVFPEPGARDIREATDVFVRRYLTRGEVRALIRDQPAGWDIAALKDLLQQRPSTREYQSVSQQDAKNGVIPEGYEVITWYTSGGNPFLTFSPSRRSLLRIEKNKHPLKWHPVFFLVLEKDDQQPLGKSQVELLLGRQEFQDLMLNGAMKLWYRNINPSIIGYGTVNSIPNLSPGKYTQISNPNARLEAFEVNTQTLLQYGQISQQNLGSMVQMVGAADQQMAVQSGNGMSATPQGVEAQQQLVDITTNNYQKAIESFFSHYCSYALTLYFHELEGVESVTPSADARRKLIDKGVKPEDFDEGGKLKVKFKDMATQYFVNCVPGSLVELEDERQLRILNELFVPLSQAMPAIGATGDTELVRHFALTMKFIVEKEIELSGSAHSTELKELLRSGESPRFADFTSRQDQLEEALSGATTGVLETLEVSMSAIAALQQQVGLLALGQQTLLEKLGVLGGGSASQEQPPAQQSMAQAVPVATV